MIVYILIIEFDFDVMMREKFQYAYRMRRNTSVRFFKEKENSTLKWKQMSGGRNEKKMRPTWRGGLGNDESMGCVDEWHQEVISHHYTDVELSLLKIQPNPN